MTCRTLTRITYAGFALACLAVIACHRGQVEALSPVGCAASTTTDGRMAFTILGRGQGTNLSSDDWRRAFVGSWHITMTVDSVQAFVHHRSVFRSVQPSCNAAGLLQITDTLLVMRDDSAQAAQLDLDLSSFYGGRFVWPGRVSLRRKGDSLQLDFCPGCFDTGVLAMVSARGDSLVGTWSELAFVGQFRAGRIAIWRKVS
jgi:hypothetical protein